ncbi:glycosyltransferase [Sporolactobacillus sp. STCC-11]|uniref:glycosyltransferase n=1 Tax=Sporolactobacillus caesalpiniae TaxID=3230362 RepID=UPI003396B558
MKKILFIMPHVTGKGGTENVMAIVMKLLQKDSNIRPSLYLFGGSEDKNWLDGVNYTETTFSDNRIIRTVQNLFSIFICLSGAIRKTKPDMVIATHSITCFVLYWLRKLSGRKFSIVSWVHFSLNVKNVNKALLKYADYHFAICPGIKQQFMEIGTQESKVYVVNNPIYRTEQIILRPKNHTVFLYIGRVIFEGQKRVKDLLESLSLVQGEWSLVVVGDGNDRAQCQKYAEQLHINQRITWYGWLEKPWDIVNEVTALVLTSEFEGLPMVLAEGISRGVYCVSSDCETGPSDIIKHEVNGELYPPHSVNQLHDILQNIVDRKKLPDQKLIQSSISQMYIEEYMRNFKKAVNDIFEIENI